jgi:hypothetical protein
MAGEGQVSPPDSRNIAQALCCSGGEAVQGSMLMRHNNIGFKIDILGVDTWRWTISPRTPQDVAIIGQVRCSREQAIAHCRAEIDALVARASNAPGG